MEKIRVAVVSGYSSSKHAIAVLAGLSAKKHIHLVFCANVKTFSFKRISSLLKRYGWHDAFEKFKNVFISSKGNRFEDETRFITQYLALNKISYKSVHETCRKLNVAYISVSSLRDETMLTKLKACKIDLLIYSGGGILQKKLIEVPSLGVLNAHGGPLPFFRGMNGLEWSLLHNVKPEVSVHLIDSGIDTGPILSRFSIDIQEGDTVYSLRGKSVVVEVKAVLTVVENITEYLKKQIVQHHNQGKQFFAMHDILKNKINVKLQNGWRPELSYEEFELKRNKLV